MKSTSTTTLLLSTVAGVILGGLLGYFLPDFMLSISFIGQLFVNALRIVLIPFIVAAVIVGVTAMADIGRINRATGKALYYFVGTSLIAVVIGLILALTLQPGANVSAAGATLPAEMRDLTSLSLSGLLGSILPADMAEAVSRGQFLWLVIVSIFFGAVLISIGDKGKAVVGFFQGLNNVMPRLVRMLMFVAPLGLLSLVATAIASNHSSLGQISSSLGLFSLAVLAGLVIQGVVVIPLFLKFVAGRSIGSFLSAVSPAITTAFGTASPAATLPVTYECVTGEGKVDSRAGAMTLPLGAVINMNGTAVYAIIAALFCVQAANADLSIVQMVVLTLSVLIVSIGSSLLPHGSLLILGVVLYAADVPMFAYAGIGLLAVVDWLFDRLRAVVNVWGDAVGAAVVANTFEFKTARRVRPTVGSRREGPSRRTGTYKRKEPSRSRPTKSESGRSPRQTDREPRRQRGRQEDRKRPTSRQEDRKRPVSGQEDRKKPQRQRRNDDRPAPSKNQGESENRDKKFVMPPVPYHVLETELKPKPRPEPSQSTTRETDRVTISAKTLERERARVAAQLDELGKNDVPSDKETETVSPTTEKIVQPPKPVSSVESRQTFPKVDFFSDDKPAAPRAGGENGPAGTENRQKEKSSDGPAAEQTQVSEPAQRATYGRSKQRRGPAKKTSTSQEKPVKDEPETPEFSSENISFGRSKKKKPGQ